MQKTNFIFFLLFFSFLIACQPPAVEQPPIMDISNPEAHKLPEELVQLSRDSLYNKVLGMLVGSAIGDAMGAPTEMWSRKEIQVAYGHVDTLDKMVRAPSPEGTWDMNLSAGGTTDDTRWKVLLTNYLTNQGMKIYQSEGPDPFPFANFIVEHYLQEVETLKATESFDPEPFEYKARRMAWLQEWALVAKAFATKDLESYSYALNRFYGGEVTCAGMLYSPMIGLVHPGATERAYAAAYRLSIFDLGYARDLSALTAALVAAAMDPKATKKTMIATLRDVDPHNYFRSRLVGRSSYRFFQQAQHLVFDARKFKRHQLADFDFQLPLEGRDSLVVAQTQLAYEALDEYNQDMPFHAGEIHQINLAALLFADFDFAGALEFVINYGRDNDTVGAITGSILGAFWGFDKLPRHMVESVLKTNKEQLGIDLEAMAMQLTDMMSRPAETAPSVAPSSD